MIPNSTAVFYAVDRGILYGASLLVPQKERAEWRQEWASELWHVRKANSDAGTVSLRTEQQIVGFCMGAFRDAACLWGFWWKNRSRFAPIHGSATQCILGLAGFLLVSCLFSILLPGARAALAFSSSSVRPGTILIHNREEQDLSVPTMTMDQVRVWQRSKQRYADGFAFYRVAKEPVQFGPHIDGTWQIAQATSNLFALGWSPRSMIPVEKDQRDVPQLFLSQRIWRQKFKADSKIIGKAILVGSRPVRVVGIAPYDTWRLPGNTDAWLLEPDSEINSNGLGYVVAHLTQSGSSEVWDGLVNITSYDLQWSERDFLGDSLEEPTPSPKLVYWFGLLLAFLALPAIISVSAAEYCFSSHKPSRIRRAVQLGFLNMKIISIVSIAYFSSIDLAYWRSPVLSSSGVYVQLAASFVICLFGMRWALFDQHRRCPVCLRKATHPAQVGLGSRMFLAWSGTELICVGGHALLHVPGLPTSWFSAQRWMYLDSSWDFLFAD